MRYTLDGMNNRTEDAEKRINDLENRRMESNQTKQDREEKNYAKRE